MKRILSIFLAAAVVAPAMFLNGCASSRMEKVETASFLGDYSKLTPGGSDEAALVYVKNDVNFRPYMKIMFERVTLWLSDDAKYRGIDPAELADLTNHFQQALLNAVSDGYQVVDQPGPGVLRVRAAITDVVPAKPVANTMSTILPVGWVVSGGTKAVTGTNLGTGQVAAEFEVLDSVTGEQLAAAVDRRQGGKAVFEGKWSDIKDALDLWAKRFRQRLDKARGVS